MSGWRGVLKVGNDYWAGELARPQWARWPEEAQVFGSRAEADAALAGLGISAARIVRRRRPSERREAEREARAAARAAEIAAENAIRQRERDRIAAWLEAWLRLNQTLLAGRRFADTAPPEQRAFTRGMVAVLSQAAPRIRVADYRCLWDYRP